MHARTLPLAQACLGALLIVTSAACGPPRGDDTRGWRAPVLGPPPAAVSPAAPAAAPVPGVDVLYEEAWFGGVSLLGVDAEGGRALVRLEAQTQPMRLMLDVIDLRARRRVDRWEATPERAVAAARARGFSPLTGTFEADIARFAGLLEQVGPWHLRGSVASPTFAVAPQRHRILFGGEPTDGTDGDWLYAAASDGHGKARVDVGLRASYSPVVSPDGRSVAFRGCVTSPCDYGLFVADLGAPAVSLGAAGGAARAGREPAKPRRVPGLRDATPPVWSTTGDALFAVGRKGEERCLVKVAPQGVVPQTLLCVRGQADVQFEQDPDGRTGVLIGVTGPAGHQQVELAWVLLADGTVLSRHTIPRGTGGGIASGTGLVALPMQKGGVGLVDLVTGHNTIVDETAGWFFGFDGARWVGDRLVLLRKLEGTQGYQIAAIDARALTAKPAGPEAR